MAYHGRDYASADPDRATPWPCLSEWLRPILPDRRCGVLGRRAMTLWGDDYMPVIVDDVSFSLDCSGCRMPMLVSVPED